MPKNHGFKKKTQKASPIKKPKVYNDYIYDIGDELSGSDLDQRIERFEATYPSKRREYQGFSFTANIEIGDLITEKEIAVLVYLQKWQEGPSCENVTLCFLVPFLLLFRLDV